MNLTLQAKPLAAALQLAASVADSRIKIEALQHARLVAEGESLSIQANVLDFALKLAVPAAVETAGEVALPSEQLAALAAGFPGDSEITIASEGRVAAVSCGRSRFRLPTIPVEDLPATAELIEVTGRVELESSELRALLARPWFAVSTEQTRYYLTGVCLHDSNDGLVSVATDGNRLVRVVAPGKGGLSQDRRLIIPRPAVKILIKLLDGKGTGRAVVLRRSGALLEAEGEGFVFASKLIDADFPAYERLIVPPSGNNVTVNCAELLRAVTRVRAVVPAQMARRPLLGLKWTSDEPVLRVVVPGWPDLADDQIEAEVAGAGRFAFQAAHGLELLAAIDGERVRFDSAATPNSAVIVTDPGDANFTGIQMPCTWFEEAAKAA